MLTKFSSKNSDIASVSEMKGKQDANSTNNPSHPWFQRPLSTQKCLLIRNTDRYFFAVGHPTSDPLSHSPPWAQFSTVTLCVDPKHQHFLSCLFYT